MVRCLLALACTALIAATASAQTAQAHWSGQNLQFYPKDITRDVLTQRMREFSFALGVRCQYCHAGGDGVQRFGAGRFCDGTTRISRGSARAEMS